MLLSTGCATRPAARYRAHLNDGRLQSPVTRSFDGYRDNNNFARNRFGSPVGRGYNVRNFSRIGNGSSTIGDNARVPSLNARNTRVTRNINTNTNTNVNVNDNEFDITANESSNEPRRSHNNISVGTEKTENKNRSLKLAPGKASEKHEKKETTHRSHENTLKQENQHIRRAHNAERLNESAAAARTRVTRSSASRSLARGADIPEAVNDSRLNRSVDTPDYTPNITNRRTALGRTHGFGRNFGFSRYNGLIRNNRGNRVSRGYVGNYNHGNNGLIRDYRFNDGLRNDGFVRNGRGSAFTRNHNYDNWNNGLYGGLNEGWNNGFNNNLARYDRNYGFARNYDSWETIGNAQRNFGHGATFVGPTYAGPYYADLGMTSSGSY